MKTSDPTLSRDPTKAEQSVLDRMEAQRERLRTRRAQRAQHQALVQAEQGLTPEAPMSVRLAVFAKQHPVAVAALAGAALIAGPKRLMRWVGVALPLVMRLRTLR